MPNSRRRRFSVHNIIPKSQNGSQTGNIEIDLDTKTTAQGTLKSIRSKNKFYPNNSKNITSLEIVADNKSISSLLSARQQSSTTVDKDVTASSSNIDFFNILNEADEISFNQNKETTQSQRENSLHVTEQRSTTQLNIDRTSFRRDKHPRPHRIKVRSPKRRIMSDGQNKSNESNKRTFGTCAIDWDQTVDVYINTLVTDTIEPIESIHRGEIPSEHSLSDMCRICHGGDTLSSELGQLISACSCRGTVGRVHVRCLERWLTESGKSRCELCGTRYTTRRVHKYGVPRALLMWILSQNAKQLMVDSLGIMLMSPLAVLAAWLSGRTLAGLMTQDSHVTPWPLASTFVLACMTLVCYYCWIVSAATRHALGWWIWYRSQYEVRLQLQDNEE